MATHEILGLSIAEIATLYRRKEVSPVEVTRLALERISELNGKLNAFITVIYDEALEAARIAEGELHAGLDRGALHGVPVAVKDLIDMAGIPTTAASAVMHRDSATQDAPVIEKLRAAGAVITGKTNLLEFAYGIVHPDYGATNNPWDLSRTSGGSSGGSAAAVSAGLCYATFGTDTGGSIRVPAAYCGVVGLKPTYGLVNLKGVMSLSWSLDHGGPMTRSCQDAAYFLDGLVGRSTGNLAEVDLGGLRLGVLSEHLEGPEMQVPVRAAFDEVCMRLKDAGATIEPVSVPHVDRTMDVIMTVIAPEASAFHARWLADQPDHYALLTRMQLDLGYVIPSMAYMRGQQFRRWLARQFLLALEEVDAILTPTVPWVAPFEDPAVGDDAGAAEGRRTAPYNMVGLPALSVPCGFSEEGLPVAIQIVTKPDHDILALRIGAAIEELLPEVMAEVRQMATTPDLRTLQAK